MKRVLLIVLAMVLAASAMAAQSIEQVISTYDSELDSEDFNVICTYDAASYSVMLVMKSQYTAAAWHEALDGQTKAITQYRHMLYTVAKAIKADLKTTDRPYVGLGATIMSSDDVLMAFSDGFTASWLDDFEEWNEVSMLY